MSQVSSRAGRNRHKYIGETQREFDEQSTSANPTLLQWSTSKIVRKGGTVTIFKNGKFHSTSENGWLIETS